MTEQVHIRTFPVELEEGEGRNLYGRLVPYNQVATVADNGPPYEEMFAAEAFAHDPRLRKAPNRVELRYEHRDGLLDSVGYGVEFTEEADGLYGTFKALATSAGDQALALARAGILRAFSVGFRAKRSRREGGVVVRLGCRLDEVSMVREGAYKGTAVALRNAALQNNLKPLRDAELDSRLSLLGYGQQDQ